MLFSVVCNNIIFGKRCVVEDLSVFVLFLEEKEWILGFVFLRFLDLDSVFVLCLNFLILGLI